MVTITRAPITKSRADLVALVGEFAAGDSVEVNGVRYVRADRLVTLETALVTIRSSIPGYLKQKMTAEEFALIVIGAADSAMVNKALEKGR